MRFHEQLHVAQAQADAGHGAIGQAGAAVELVEHAGLLGGRDADAVVGHREGEAMPVQRAGDGDVDGVARILHGILQQVAQDVAEVHGVGRHGERGREVGLERHELVVGDVQLAEGLLGHRAEVEGAEAERHTLVVGPRHVAQLLEVGREVVHLDDGVVHHRIGSLRVGTEGRVGQVGQAHLQRLYGTLQFVYHGAHEAAAQLIHPPLLQDGLDLEEQAHGQQGYHQQAARQLAAHAEQQHVAGDADIDFDQLALQGIVGIDHLRQRPEQGAAGVQGGFPLVEAVGGGSAQAGGEGDVRQGGGYDGVERMEVERMGQLQTHQVGQIHHVEAFVLPLVAHQDDRVGAEHGTVGQQAGYIHACRPRLCRGEVRQRVLRLRSQALHQVDARALLPRQRVDTVVPVDVGVVPLHGLLFAQGTGFLPTQGVVAHHGFGHLPQHFASVGFVGILIVAPQPVALPRPDEEHGGQGEQPDNLDASFHRSLVFSAGKDKPFARIQGSREADISAAVIFP